MKTSNSNLIEINNLNIIFKKKLLLQDISFNLKKGDFVMITGPNGSGKTTLVEYMSKQVYSKHVKHSKKLIFSYVPQISYFLGNVQEILNRYAFAFSNTKNMQKVIHNFSLESLLYSEYDRISSGEKQRVLLAISFLQKPDIIILDEFARGLDENIKQEFIHLINNIHKEYPDIAIILISHKDDIISGFKTENYMIKNKKLVKGVFNV